MTGTGKTLLRRQDLKDLGIPYSRMSLYRLVAAGKFPKPLQIGPNRRAWLASDIDAWLAERAAERDQQAA